jgi:release factor glutamine methyltransferase
MGNPGGFALSTSIVATLRAAGCVFAEDEAEVILSSAHSDDEIAAMVRQRVAGLPLEYVVGWAEFAGIRIIVEPGVFVPRHRTELMVREAAALVRARPADPPPTVLDLGCGSGALGAALHATAPVDLWAVDVDPAAVACARRNVGANVLIGDLYEPLPARLRGHVAVIMANAPYVPTDAIALMPPEARVHEHRVALDGGRDGLDVVRRVVRQAPAWLVAGGHVLVEASEDQADAVAEQMLHDGLTPRVSQCEDLGATIVLGELCSGGPRSDR